MKRVTAPLLALLAVLCLVIGIGEALKLFHPLSAYAACSPSGTTYGTDSLTVSAPSSTTYVVWTRLQAPSSAADSIMLEVDGGNCYTVGGSSSMPANTWTWVNYINGSTASPLHIALSQGAHTFKFIGTNPNEAVDLILLLDSSNTCVPTGTGQNCAPSSNPVPTVNFTTPAAGATVSGSGVSVAANAAVSSGSITNITLKAAGTTLKSCANATSCSSAWDTTLLTNGAYTLEADTTASDGNTNTATESVTVNNRPPCTLTPPTSITSPSQTTSSIALSWSASSDSCYPASQLTYHVSRNGGQVGSTSAGTTSYTDSGLNSGTTYSYTITASDPGGNNSVASAAFTQKTKTPNCSAPAAPKGLMAPNPTSTSVSLSWQPVANPSSTCVVTGYVVSRDGAPLAQPSGTSYTDNSVAANTTYTYSVLAIVTGNIAGPSASLQVKTPISQQQDPGPSAPTHLTATAISTSQINLSWSPSTDAVTGIKNYVVLRNGTQIGTTTTTAYGDSGLSAHTQYSYQIKAISGGGLASTSAEVSSTTLSSSGGGGNGGGGGSGNNHNSNSSPYVSPILQGTKSVGSGSQNGGSTSQDPTAPGAKSVELPSEAQPSSSSITIRKVAYVGGSALGVLVLLGVVWLLMVRRRMRGLVLPSPDPDLGNRIVVVDNGRGPHGPSPTGVQPPPVYNPNDRERRL